MFSQTVAALLLSAFTIQSAAAIAGVHPYYGQIRNFIPIAGKSSFNNNPIPPAIPIYPQKGPTDATYSIPEAKLRAAIYIPPTFTYGNDSKQPVLLVPGTGASGGVTYEHNFAKLLAASSFASPVWLNIPTDSLQDIQANSEFVAYAINYISAISSQKKISVISWSQGGINTQWAFKYWPSTRSVVNDFIPISADFHGTKLAPVACVVGGCTPAVKQQHYFSKLVYTLRSYGGDSAYVPTTSVYSCTDEVVQPQSGYFASAILKDIRGVGVTNTQVQKACPFQRAGKLYTHEGVLVNPIAYALAVDALTHDGPGSLSRINLPLLCQLKLAPGLTPVDYEAAGVAIVTAGVNAELFPIKTLIEPPIRPYVYTAKLS